MKGIDISQHNGAIDFNKVKKEVDFIILRVGWIGNKNNNTIDTRFEQYYRECKRFGIPVGVYVYCYSNNEAAAEAGAKWTLDKLKGKELQLPVYIDMEDNSIKSLGKNKLTNIAIAFNTVIEKAGYRAGVYANLDWFNNYLHRDIIKFKYTTWIAHYGLLNKNKYKGVYDILQYTSSGKVSGITGRVDVNEMYKDLIIKPTSFIQGEKVRVEVPVAVAYDNGESSIVDSNGYQFWINDKAIKDGKINYEGIVCYAQGDGLYIVQILDNQFWCKEQYLHKIK